MSSSTSRVLNVNARLPRPTINMGEIVLEVMA
jgi:hypothetical protein